MTTIRDELAAMLCSVERTAVEWPPSPAAPPRTTGLDTVLRHLGIDPDLPAEWATVDRCLRWLERRGLDLGGVEEAPRIEAVHRYSCTFFGPEDSDEFEGKGDSLHGALVAACRVVGEPVEITPESAADRAEAGLRLALPLGFPDPSYSKRLDGLIAAVRAAVGEDTL